MQVSDVLREGRGFYAHYCPGCDDMHSIPMGKPHPSSWTFDGDVERPTFRPSVKHTTHRDGKPWRVCHYYITAGRIEFCGDCWHVFSGRTVPLGPIPERYSDENYSWPE